MELKATIKGLDGSTAEVSMWLNEESMTLVSERWSTSIGVDMDGKLAIYVVDKYQGRCIFQKASDETLEEYLIAHPPIK